MGKRIFRISGTDFRKGQLDKGAAMLALVADLPEDIHRQLSAGCRVLEAAEPPLRLAEKIVAPALLG